MFKKKILDNTSNIAKNKNNFKKLFKWQHKTDNKKLDCWLKQVRIVNDRKFAYKVIKLLTQNEFSCIASVSNKYVLI